MKSARLLPNAARPAPQPTTDHQPSAARPSVRARMPPATPSTLSSHVSSSWCTGVQRGALPQSRGSGRTSLQLDCLSIACVARGAQHVAPPSSPRTQAARAAGPRSVCAPRTASSTTTPASPSAPTPPPSRSAPWAPAGLPAARPASVPEPGMPGAGAGAAAGCGRLQPCVINSNSKI